MLFEFLLRVYLFPEDRLYFDKFVELDNIRNLNVKKVKGFFHHMTRFKRFDIFDFLPNKYQYIYVFCNILFSCPCSTCFQFRNVPEPGNMFN